jgi:SulP family sulfate permease
MRFVSYSVTTGFLTGVAVLLILSQLPTIAGYEAEGDNGLAKTFDLLAHLGEVNWTSVAMGALALLLAIFLPRTPIGNVGRLIAIIVPSVVLAVMGLNSVEIVQDVGEIPQGIPTPAMPSLSGITFNTITGALAVTIVILVQGTGVSQSVPNPDGSPRRLSRDFVAQGAANAASGLFQGLPVGGSVSATALNVIAGARTRWSVIFAGIGMAVVVIVFPDLVAYVAMPALGAMLVLAGASSIKPSDMQAVWNAGWPSWLAGGATFLAMLVLPIEAAVGIGVVLSALLYVLRSSTGITLVQLVERSDGEIEERSAPDKLPGNQVTILDVYGDLFYAGARTLERILPEPQPEEKHPVVVLRLRRRKRLGATLIDVLSRYAGKLDEVDGRLYLSGIDEQGDKQLRASGKLDLTGPVREFEAQSVVGRSTRDAIEHARTWLVSVEPGNGPSDDSSDEEER